MSTRGGPAADLDMVIDSLLADRLQPQLPAEDDLLATARLLRDVLPRYHPRFGFEERLAERLAAAGRPGARRVTGQLLLWPRPAPGIVVAPVAKRRRGLLAGGAIASGISLAVPLATAALVAWRRGRVTGGSI